MAASTAEDFALVASRGIGDQSLLATSGLGQLQAIGRVVDLESLVSIG